MKCVVWECHNDTSDGIEVRFILYAKEQTVRVCNQHVNIIDGGVKSYSIGPFKPKEAT